MLVHAKATSFCARATLLFEKPIWFSANVMLQCEKTILLYAKAMCRRSGQRYLTEAGGTSTRQNKLTSWQSNVAISKLNVALR